MTHQPVVTIIVAPHHVVGDIEKLVPERMRGRIELDNLNDVFVTRYWGVEIRPSRFLDKHIVLMNSRGVVGVIELEELNETQED
jgi:hypothetical protein